MPGGTLQKKWTEKSIAAGFIAVPVVLLRNYSRLRPAITDFEFVFLVNLADYFRDGKAAYPSWETLAQDLDVDPEIIRSTVESLNSKGYVETVTFQGDRGTVTGYDIAGLRKALDALLSIDTPTNPRHENVRR